MELKRIDIDNIIKYIDESTYCENYQTTVRRIITRILRITNEYAMKYGKPCSNILVSSNIYEYISDTSAFNVLTYNIVGNIAGFNIFDGTTTLKDNEIFLFDEMSELNFIKRVIRAKKLERILCRN